MLRCAPGPGVIPHRSLGSGGRGGAQIFRRDCVSSLSGSNCLRNTTTHRLLIMAAVKNPARENQHTRRRANRNVKENRNDWKAKLKVSHLMNRLADSGDGRVALEPTQIKAIEILLDRVVPRLSSVEQTQTNDLDALDRGESACY